MLELGRWSAMSLKMSSELRDDTLVILLDGELTSSESPDFKTWVTGQLDGTPARVELDCHEVLYIDSTGLGSLIFLRKAVLDGGGSLRLTRVSGWLLKFLQVTGLEETFMVPKRDSQS